MTVTARERRVRPSAQYIYNDDSRAAVTDALQRPGKQTLRAQRKTTVSNTFPLRAISWVFC